MKTRSTRSLRRLQFKIRLFCDYAEQIGQLEKALARKPEKLHLDIIGKPPAGVPPYNLYFESGQQPIRQFAGTVLRMG